MRRKTDKTGIPSLIKRFGNHNVRTNSQERLRPHFVDNSQHIHDSQYFFSIENSAEPSKQFENTMELKIHEQFSFQPVARTKTKLLKISGEDLTKPDQYIRDLSIIQWLMYSEFCLSIENKQRSYGIGNSKRKRSFYKGNDGILGIHVSTNR